MSGVVAIDTTPWVPVGGWPHLYVGARVVLRADAECPLRREPDRSPLDGQVGTIDAVIPRPDHHDYVVTWDGRRGIRCAATELEPLEPQP